jgi:hypothetical protein
VQQAYPSLAPGFHSLIAALSEQQRQLLLQQQQQQPAPKRRKLSSGSPATAAAAALEPTDATMRLLLALRCLLRWQNTRRQGEELPLLLHLLLFGGPVPAVEGVVESIDLVSDEEDESLNRQLMRGDAGKLIAREVQPRESLQQQQAGSPEEEGSGGSGSGRARIKQEPI